MTPTARKTVQNTGVDVYFSHPDKELLAMVISSYAEGLMGEFMDKILGVDVSFIFKN